MQRILQEHDYIVWTNLEESISLEIENEKSLVLTINNTEVVLSKEMLGVILPHVNRFYRTGKFF